MCRLVVRPVPFAKRNVYRLVFRPVPVHVIYYAMDLLYLIGIFLSHALLLVIMLFPVSFRYAEGLPNRLCIARGSAAAGSSLVSLLLNLGIALDIMLHLILIFY